MNISTNEPSETDFLLDVFGDDEKDLVPTNKSNSASISSPFDIFKKLQGASNNATDTDKKTTFNKQKISDKKAAAWMDLFADLDPLANPINLEKKIAGLNQNCLDA